MTDETLQEPTPEKIADLATTKAHLPRLALIGIFGSATVPAALVREKSGTTTRVSTGDKIARHTIAAIGADHIVLARGAQTKVLRLPDT
jgi:hypothetical protein